MTADAGSAPALRRDLGLGDAVVVGLAAMIGAGVFTASAPAAAVAGSGLLVGLAVAAVVAYANATSSARSAAVHPGSGGTCVYGRRRLGPFWGYLASWSLVVVVLVCTLDPGHRRGGRPGRRDRGLGDPPPPQRQG